MLKPVVIAGATASGKSDLALRIAERDGGCVINADALQVYRCWHALSARPSVADVARAPHRLYGHVDCRRRYSVGDWLREIAVVLDEARALRLRPVIVGGTGLYMTALTEGLAEIPPIPPKWRARSQALLDAGRIDEMLDALRRADPQTHGAIDRRNPVRVQRAWEVWSATGKGLRAWQGSAPRPLLPMDDADCAVLQVEKTILDKRISDRFQRMIEAGAIAECAAFADEFGDPALPSAQALGRVELSTYLSGRMTLDEARERAVTATRRFAKRQRSWFRSRMAHWRRIDGEATDPLAAVPAQSVR